MPENLIYRDPRSTRHWQRCPTRAFPYRGQRRAPWSVSRGDCRFDAGHAGDCKPAGR